MIRHRDGATRPYCERLATGAEIGTRMEHWWNIRGTDRERWNAGGTNRECGADR